MTILRKTIIAILMLFVVIVLLACYACVSEEPRTLRKTAYIRLANNDTVYILNYELYIYRDTVNKNICYAAREGLSCLPMR